MAFIVLVLFFLCITFARNNVSDFVSKIFIYSYLSYWFLAIFCSLYSPYDIYPVHSRTLIFLFLAAISFTFGFVSIRIHPKDENHTNDGFLEINSKLGHLLKSKILITCFLVSAIFCLTFARQALLIASLQSHAEMVDQYELIFMGNNRAQTIFGYLITPLFHVGMMLFWYGILNIKSLGKNVLLPLGSIAFLFICYLIIAGGRSTFIVVALYLLITYFCTTPPSVILNLSTKKVLFSVLIIVGLTVGIQAVNNYRHQGEFSIATNNTVNSGDSPGEIVARYTLLPMVLFDNALEKDFTHRYGGYKLGRATFAGLDGWVGVGLNKIGIPYKSTQEVVEDVQANYYEYAPGRTANYAYTGLFYHYLDFGIIGIILFPFLFGLAIRHTIRRYGQAPKISYLLLLCLCFFMMMHAMFTCYLIKGWVVIYIICLLVLGKIEKNYT